MILFLLTQSALCMLLCSQVSVCPPVYYSAGSMTAPPPISIDLNYSEELWEWGRWQRSLSRTLEGSHFPLIPPLCSWNGHHIKGEISESGDFKIVVI